MLQYANPIIQEFIPGYVHDACLLMENGKTLAILTQTRQLMYPITGGSGRHQLHHPRSAAQGSRHTPDGSRWTGPARRRWSSNTTSATRNTNWWKSTPNCGAPWTCPSSPASVSRVLIRDLLMGEKVSQPAYEAGNYYYFLYPQTSLAPPAIPIYLRPNATRACRSKPCTSSATWIGAISGRFWGAS